jgi:Domain of unknown function (DUF4190)/Helix-hairpin-helix motif
MNLSVSQARRVVAHRDNKGGFQSLEELGLIPGFSRESLRELNYELTGVTETVPVAPAPRARQRRDDSSSRSARFPADVAHVSARPTKTSGKATWALILSLIGLVVVPVGLSTLGIALGVLAKMDMKSDPRLGGRGRATAAIVIGVVGLVLWAIATYVYLNNR